MSIDTIYIPTFKRVDRQITYNNLPLEFKAKVKFIINECESNLDFFKDKQIIIVPDHFKIAEKRECAFLNSQNEKFVVMDDDIIFYKRDKVTSFKLQTLEDFNDLFKEMSEILDIDNIVLACPLNKVINPGSYEYLDASSTTGQVNFFNGSKLSKLNIDWTRFEVFEDLYVVMQILEQGYINRTITKYYFDSGKINDTGGSQEFRDYTSYNKALLDFKKLYPKYVKIRSNKTSKSIWNIKGNAFKKTLYLNKLYKDSLLKLKAKKLFS